MHEGSPQGVMTWGAAVTRLFAECLEPSLGHRSTPKGWDASNSTDQYLRSLAVVSKWRVAGQRRTRHRPITTAAPHSAMAPPQAAWP